jgi:hypothetical protein
MCPLGYHALLKWYSGNDVRMERGRRDWQQGTRNIRLSRVDAWNEAFGEDYPEDIVLLPELEYLITRSREGCNAERYLAQFQFERQSFPGPVLLMLDWPETVVAD